MGLVLECEKIKLLKDQVESLGGSLVAVSKTVDEARVKEAYACGLRDFGENYLSEACSKIENLSDLSIRWHYLGRVQTGTLNKLINRFSLIHTIAKLEHLLKINEKTKAPQDVLIQIKHPLDKRDYGVLEEDLDEFLKTAFKLENINVLGLMFIAPLDMSGEEIGLSFLWAKKHFDRVRKSLGLEQQKNWSVLSMGMSGDFIDALKHGATHVRLGRSIFGER